MMLVGPERLFLSDLTDEHLTMLLRAVQYRPEESVDAWLKEVAERTLEVYAWPSTNLLVGVRQERARLWIEFLTGRGFVGRETEVLAWLQSFGLPLATLASRPGIYRLTCRLGFVPVAVEMRRD